MEKNKISLHNVGDLPVFLTAKEANRLILNISEVKLYEMLNSEGCPKLMVGRKILLPAKKFLQWLDEKSD